MITHLRRRHRWMVTTLFIVVACFYAWALMARRAVPRVPHPPGSPPPPGHEEVVR